MSDIFSIQNLSDVFVTNNSVIIDKGRAIKDSCVAEEYFTKYQKIGFRLKYFLPFFSFSKKQHILITDEWSKNYCHWLWEAMSKALLLKKQFPDAILVLPKSYVKIDFVMKSLAACGFHKDNIKFIPKKSKLKIKNLAFIPCINIGTDGYYNFLKFREVSETLVEHHKEKLEINFGERIYISRNRPDKYVPRRVVNESELVAMLEKYDFKTVYMENFSFIEQISIATNAKFIVAPHGAGITNVMFSGAKSHLFELVNKQWSKTCFAQMCERIRAAYIRINCNQASDGNTVHLGDIHVDIAKLEAELTKNIS